VICAGLVQVTRLIIAKSRGQNDEEFNKTWDTFFEEFKEGKMTNLFYGLYFLRRLVIGCLIMFSRSGLFQIVCSAAASLLVFYKQIAVYVFAAKPFLENRTNVYMVASELVLTSYYMAIMVGILSIDAISVDTIGLACIKICIVALGMNCLYSISGAVEVIYQKCCRKKSKVQPMEDADRSHAGNVTMMAEPEDLFHKRGGEQKKVSQVELKSRNKF
jgi:hypothetical protein